MAEEGAMMNTASGFGKPVTNVSMDVAEVNVAHDVVPGAASIPVKTANII